MRRLVAVLMWLILPGLSAQEIVSALRHPTGFPLITLGIHGIHNNGATSTTTVVLSGSDWSGSLSTPTVGSTIVCFVKSTNDATWVTVTDNVNSGSYQGMLGLLRDAGHNFKFGAFYKENVAASSTTITMTMGTGANGELACQEWKGVPTAYVLDSNFLYSLAATTTNPAYTSSVTPTGANEVIVDGTEGSTSGVTAGANFTLGDNASTLWTQYWIQTTATATNGAFVKSASSSYAIGLASLAQNHTGTCGITVSFNWSGAGATSGSTVATSTLAASTLGGGSQPNADSYTPTLGWSLVGSATGLTFNTGAYVPMVTTRTCPFGTGNGTGTLGLQFDTSQGTNHGAEYVFWNTQSKTTLWTCVSTNISPASNASKGIDLIALKGGDFGMTGEGSGDYLQAQLNVSSGAAGKWQIEAPGGNSAASTSSWVANTNYGLLLTYNQAGIHTLGIYNGCGSSPTLIETLSTTGTVAGGAPADLVLIVGAANTYTSGTINFGSSAADYLYGSTLTP